MKLHSFKIPFNSITRFFFLLSFLTFFNNAFSQTRAASNIAMNEVKNILTQYEKQLDIIGKGSSSEKTKEAENTWKALFKNNEVYLYPDMDTSSGKLAFLTVKEYVKRFRSMSDTKSDIRLYRNEAQILPAKFDSERNAYTIEATLKNRITYYKIDSSLIDTVYTLSDGTEATEMMKYDTIRIRETNRLTFYFHMDLQDGSYTNIKIAAIGKKGKAAKWPEQSKDMKWWTSLDDNWKKLIIQETKINSIPTEEELKNVSKIKRLDMSSFPISDFAPLNHLTSIERLSFKGTKIDTLYFLNTLTKLERLDLSETKVKSLAGLENCESLKVLVANNLNIVDLTPLSNLKKLIYLDLSGNQIENIQPLANCRLLEDLILDANVISDISPLSKILALQELSIGKNPDITSLAAISSLPNLIELNIFNTGVTNLNDISNMKKITRLDISYTKINTLSGIKHLNYLSELKFAGNSLDSYSAIKGFPYLRVLVCSQTSISDISLVMNLAHLQVFTANDTGFTKSEIQRFKKDHPKCQITYWE